jgi:hypothetical protein
MSKDAAESLEKTAYEAKYYVFDFSDELEVGETISPNPAVTALPAGLTIGTPVINGQAVQVKLSSGTAGVSYVVTCKIGTSATEAIEGSGRLTVTDR